MKEPILSSDADKLATANGDDGLQQRSKFSQFGAENVNFNKKFIQSLPRS